MAMGMVSGRNFNQNTLYFSNLTLCRLKFYLLDFMASMAFSFLINPVENLESRLVIQNRLKGFKNMKSVWDFSTNLQFTDRTFKELFKVEFSIIRELEQHR